MLPQPLPQVSPHLAVVGGAGSTVCQTYPRMSALYPMFNNYAALRTKRTPTSADTRLTGFRRSGSCGARFPASFRPPAFASWAPCPAKDFRPSYDRPTGRPAPTRACRTDPGEVSTFRTHETRTGPGALYTPGTAVFAGRRPVRGRRLPPLSGRSLAPRYNDPARSAYLAKHQQEFPGSRPVPVLPLTCGRHGWDGGPWAFP